MANIIPGWNITTLAKALEPFLLQIVRMAPSASATLLNRIILIPSGSGDPSVYPKTSAGLNSASTAAASGDKIYFPPCTIGSDHTFADGVEYWGARKNTILTGKITALAAVLHNLSITRTANDANELTSLEIASNISPIIFNCDISIVQSGAGNAYGVKVSSGTGQPRLEYCNIDAQSVGGNGIGVYHHEETAGPATMTEYNKGVNGGSGTINWGASLGQWNANGSNSIAWAIWHLDMNALSYGAGQLRATIYCSSGSTEILVFGDPTNLDPTATPRLNGNDSGPDIDISAGQTEIRLGSAPFTFQDGYFGLYVQGTYNISLEITKLEWSDDEGDNWYVLWEPSGATSADTTLRWCKTSGSTTDLDASNGGTINVYACQFDNSSVAGTIVYLEGDRSAYDVTNYGARHASDWAAGDSHHAPVSLAADADTVLGLSAQELSLDTQTANTVFAGPSSGAAADPAFRALVAADITGLAAPTTSEYLTTAADGTLSAEVVIPGLAGSPDIAGIGGAGTSEEYDTSTTGLTWTPSTPNTVDSDTTRKSHLYVKSTDTTERIGTKAWAPAGAFDARAKVSHGGSNNSSLDVLITNSDNSSRALMLIQVEGTENNIKAYTFASSTYTQRGSSIPWLPGLPVYLRITRDGSNNVSFYCSGDGYTWFPIDTGIAFTFTVANIGYRSANAAHEAFVDFLRTDV